MNADIQETADKKSKYKEGDCEGHVACIPSGKVALMSSLTLEGPNPQLARPRVQQVNATIGM